MSARGVPAITTVGSITRHWAQMPTARLGSLISVLV
jgi:hypothetical protein